MSVVRHTSTRKHRLSSLLPRLLLASHTAPLFSCSPRARLRARWDGLTTVTHNARNAIGGFRYLDRRIEQIVRRGVERDALAHPPVGPGVERQGRLEHPAVQVVLEAPALIAAADAQRQAVAHAPVHARGGAEDGRLCGAKAGQLRCRLHSRSKFALSIDVYANARTVRQIRMAERTLGALNWPQGLDPAVRFTDSLIVVCHILWRLDERDQASWIEVLTRTLNQAPLIQSKLSPDFLELSSAAQLTELRNLIDEHEWTPSRWPAKIAAAENWFLALQHFCKPRTRGLSEENRRRVAQASNWINEGTPKKLVAERLGISKSYLSKLLERAQKGLR